MLNKINFYLKCIKCLPSIQITKVQYFSLDYSHKRKTTSMFTCPHFLLLGNLIHPIPMETTQTANLKHIVWLRKLKPVAGMHFREHSFISRFYSFYDYTMVSNKDRLEQNA